MQAFEMKFLRKIKEVTMFDVVHNTVIQYSVNIESHFSESKRRSLRLVLPRKQNASAETASQTNFTC